MAVVHISTLTGARMAIDAGADGLVHIFGDRAPDADFAKLVAGHHAFVVPTLTVVESASGVPSGASLADDARFKPYLDAGEIGGLKTSFPKHASSETDLGNAKAAVRTLKAANVPILAGTDAPNPGVAHGASIHRELELLVAAGLTPIEALTAATATPAKVFKLDDRGRIARGLRADLVLVDGDPTSDILATRAIAAVWRNGAPVVRQPETPAVQALVESVAPEKLARGVISNFDSGAAAVEIGSGWFVSTDQMAGGKSEASMTVADGALHVVSDMKEGFAYPWAGAMVNLGSAPMKAVDLSSKKGIAFYARGGVSIRVMLFARKLGWIPAQTIVKAGDDWTPLTVLWSDFGVDGKDVQAVLFGGVAVGRSEFWIDEVRLE